MLGHSERTAVVLASSSFAGSCFCHFLMANGVKVIGTVRSSSNLFIGERLYNLRNPLYREIRCDTATSLPELTKVLNFKKVDWVIDFANQGMVAPSWDHPNVWYQTNLSAKSEFIRLLVEDNWRGRYLKVSTPEVYGSSSDAIAVSAAINPSTPYAISHAAFDQHLLAVHANWGLDIVLARFANFYGEGQQLYRIIPRTIIYGLLGRSLTLDGGGSSERAFIHRDDFCDALVKCLTKGESGATFHFSDPDCYSIRRIVEKCCDLIEKPFDDLVQLGMERVGKDQRYFLDCSTSHELLGWRAHVGLDQGLARVVNWVLENLETLKHQPLDYVLRK